MENEILNHDGKVKFAFQFGVNSNSIFNITIASNPLFAKTEYNEVKEMKIKPTCYQPSKHFDRIVNAFNRPIIVSLLRLKEKIIEHSNIDDSKIEIYVPTAIDMCIKHMNVINRVKMERILIIIKTGINCNCHYSILKALVELECNVNLYYPEDRRYFCESESDKFKKSIIDMTIVEPKTIISLLNNIKLDSNINQPVRDIMLKLTNDDKPKIMKLIIDYLNTIGKIETIINSTKSVHETFQVLNSIQNEKFEFGILTIAMTICDGEIYVEYYGFVDKEIGGLFSLDLYRFRNFINDNLTYYIFYLVTCHYCMMYSDNILNVKFNIISTDVHDMFIFFERQNLDKVMESIEEIPTHICYKKMFAHLYKLFYELMEITRPEQKKILLPIKVNEPEKTIDRLSIIKDRNKSRKLKSALHKVD